jgi:anti-sigma factor RsiW
MTNDDGKLCACDGSIPTEVDIQAFVDGQLDASRLADLQRYLRRRPDEARRVAFYDKLNQRMQRRFREK